ncbi:Proteinase inhibitor [Spatholobus suberectus]|nr:Proteinase inhibitor [Spatholobus suberectus]
MASILCQGKSSWPEVVGTNGEVAAVKIERENENVHTKLVTEGSMVTMDFWCNRVWVWVDENGVVTRVPKIG